MFVMRFTIFLALFFSMFPVLSSEVCYKSDSVQKKLMTIFVANLSNDQLIDPEGTNKLVVAIKNASASKRYDLYEEAVNNLTAYGNSSASLLKALMWFQTGDINKCLDAYALLREVKNNTKNHTLAHDLKRIIDRKNKQAVKEPRQSHHLESPARDQSLMGGDVGEIEKNSNKSLILIFEN